MLQVILLLLQLCVLPWIVSAELPLHSCIHDSLNHSSRTVPQQYKSPPILFSVSAAQSSATFSPSSPPILSLKDTQPLRIIIDTQFLETGADKGYACYRSGDSVAIDEDTHVCSSKDILSTEARNYLETVLLPRAKEALSKAFYTLSVSGNLILAQDRCGFQGGVEIPDKYLGDGFPDADIVVFVTSRPIAQQHVLAFGGECQSDQRGRPVAGHLNISPSNIDTSPYELVPQLGMVMHELTHVLGFSFNKLITFVPPPGMRKAIPWIETTTKATADNSAKSVYRINTPSVTSWIRQHFNCSELDGAELEDGGGDGTKLSHWEKRIFMNEYMTGQSTRNPVFSGLTLALFEDSGWYAVDYSTAEHLVWGHNMGCSIAREPCSNWNASDSYFCTSKSQTGASFDLQAKGSCDIDSRSPAPPHEYQYYGSNSIGGPSSLADYCAYITASPTGWCTDDRNGELIRGEIVTDGEKFCKGCRSFQSTLIRDFPVGGDLRSTCYEAACIGEAVLKVSVDDVWYDCPAGEEVTVEGYGGYIHCPEERVLASVCAGSAIDPSWPVIREVSPKVGGPGTVVTIVGTGFSNVSRVVIHAECQKVQVIGEGMVIVTVPHSIHFASPAHLIRSTVDVMVLDGKGRMGVGRNMFDVKVAVDMEWLSWFLAWLGWHWPQVLCALVAVGVAMAVRHYYKNKRSNEKMYIWAK